MTTREMFEALGYEFEDYHFHVPRSQGIMIPQDEPKFIYTKRYER